MLALMPGGSAALMTSPQGGRIVFRNPLSYLKNFRSDERIRVENLLHVLYAGVGQVCISLKGVVKIDDVSGREASSQRNYDTSSYTSDCPHRFRKSINERLGDVDRNCDVSVLRMLTTLSLCDGRLPLGRTSRVFWHGGDVSAKPGITKA